MRSRELKLEVYDTDKVLNGYFYWYDPVLAPLVYDQLKLLELGVHKGGSLQLWRDYFPHAQIVGVDLKLPEDFEPGERIQVFQGSQSDESFLTSVAERTAPEGFDIVIDDASHIGELTRKAFWHLFDHHLKPGGLYVIEDWGTGYWDDWPDGKRLAPKKTFRQTLTPLLPPPIARRVKTPVYCHAYGMVGFIKELVDEQCRADISRMLWSGKPTRASKFEEVTITPSIVFVKKRPAVQV